MQLQFIGTVGIPWLYNPKIVLLPAILEQALKCFQVAACWWSGLCWHSRYFGQPDGQVSFLRKPKILLKKMATAWLDGRLSTQKDFYWIYAEKGSDVIKAALWIHCTFQFLTRRAVRAHPSTQAIRWGLKGLVRRYSIGPACILV